MPFSKGAIAVAVFMCVFLVTTCVFIGLYVKAQNAATCSPGGGGDDVLSCANCSEYTCDTCSTLPGCAAPKTCTCADIADPSTCCTPGPGKTCTCADIADPSTCCTPSCPKTCHVGQFGTLLDEDSLSYPKDAWTLYGNASKTRDSNVTMYCPKGNLFRVSDAGKKMWCANPASCSNEMTDTGCGTVLNGAMCTWS
jgi:hypothetical protein